MKRALAVIVALSLGPFGIAMFAARGDQKVDNRIFELRTYHCAPGKMDALKARFRDHTCKLFQKHRMTVIGFWNPADPQQAGQTLIYLLAFPGADAAARCWKEFGADPEWRAVKEASEKDGKLVEKIDSVFLNPADFSPMK
jgi:hypothetical protein